MDFLTLVFFVAAVIIFFRLRSVLGQRNGAERPPQERKWPAELKPVEMQAEVSKMEKKSASSVSSLPETSADARLEGVELNSSAASSLRFIADADPGFRLPHFMKGAKAAYEMIVAAFAKGDRAALRKLLVPEIFETFEEEIAAREKRGETVDLHFVGIEKAQIAEATLKGSTAQITIDFVSKLVQATRNAAGEVIEGDASSVTEVGDRWTFERKVTSSDPNWKLAAAEDA